MNFPGLTQLRKHFPDLRSTTGSAGLALLALGCFALTTLFFIWTDRLIPDWQPDGQIIVMALGFLIMSRFFSQKDKYQERYEELAYRNAFVRFAIPGLAVIFATVAHCAYMPGIGIPDLWWKDALRVLGGIYALIGVGLWVRAILTFGADNLAMLYVYHPEDSRLVDTDIYGVLRHPVYSGALRVIIGLCLLNGSWPALFFALLSPLGLTGWVRLVEEKELLMRFPDYVQYRKRVPAFWTWQVIRFWRFLIKGI